VLSDALEALPGPSDPDLLVGFEANDDAAVYRISDDAAVISTADFITPPVDEPEWFGRIAAANALSDVYAMGGRPVCAISLLMYPEKALGEQVLAGILAGGHEKVTEAGASLAGGHSVDDLEPKYGLAVTGVVHPERILRNGGALPGDALILTKPIGTGVLFNACRSGRLPRSELDPVLPQVAGLNQTALEVALQFEIHACTDITGFGLAGHAIELAEASGVRLELELNSLPLYPNALAMYGRGETTGSNAANRALVSGRFDLDADHEPVRIELLFDPQTSGGLLLAVPGSQAADLVERLREAGVASASQIGRAIEGAAGIGVV
jgi:selenide,water dikinase